MNMLQDNTKNLNQELSQMFDNNCDTYVEKSSFDEFWRFIKDDDEIFKNGKAISKDKFVKVVSKFITDNFINKLDTYNIPSQTSLNFTGSIKSEHNRKRVNHALAYPKMR